MKIFARLLIIVLFLSFSALADAKKRGARHLNKSYHTYYKIHPETGDVYVGRTSGVSGQINDVARRDRHHHMNKHGYGPAQVLKSSKNKDAIRGYEQKMIDKYRAVGKSGNKINGISHKNKKRKRYMKAAEREFGKG